MKLLTVFSSMFLILTVFLNVGCDSVAFVADPVDTFNSPGYLPARVRICPLTEYNLFPNSDRFPRIRIFLNLYDAFGSQIKSPGVFRFELYEYVHRSADPKGKRITIWPDIDLKDLDKNNEYWRDFLRAYEFNLDFDPQAPAQSYVLQVTCFCPNGRRLLAEYTLKPAN